MTEQDESLEALEALEEELEGDVKPLKVDEEERSTKEASDVGEKEVHVEENADDADEEEGTTEEPPKGFIATYWMLLLGVLLSLSGMITMILLRLNIIQVYLLGDSDPYPGIGRAEPMGHVAGVVFFVIGILLILFWGLKTKEPEAEPESA